MAAANFAALDGVATRRVTLETPQGPHTVVLQHNAARARSTCAKVDAASVAARECFLCACHRPREQKSLLPCELSPSLAGLDYEILVNPFPIFPMHFTVPATGHIPQIIAGESGCPRFGDMLRLAEAAEGMALFYNGASCGASAPDHFHFQMVEAWRLPLLQHPEGAPFRVCVHETASLEQAQEWFGNVARSIKAMQQEGLCGGAAEPEGRMNVLCKHEGGVWRTVVIPRRAHRPDFYGDGEGQYLLSPASVDLSGVVVVPSPEDFRTVTPDIIAGMLAQTCYPAAD